MAINIELPKSELDKLLKDFNKYSKDKKNQIGLEIEGTLRDILKESKDTMKNVNKSYVTGDLYRSGDAIYNDSKKSGLVEFKMNYAASVERRKPFLRPVLPVNVKKLVENIKKILSKT